MATARDISQESQAQAQAAVAVGGGRVRYVGAPHGNPMAGMSAESRYDMISDGTRELSGIEIIERLDLLSDILSMIVIVRSDEGSGAILRADRWMREASIPGFGDVRPVELLRQGRGKVVVSYLSEMRDGGYA